MSLTKTVGHLLLGTIFITGGAGTFMDPEPRASKVEAAGITPARQAAILNGAVMVIGGSALAAGILPKIAATLLIGALLPTTFVGHPFWKEDQPGNRANQQIQFLKNISMLGGLFLVLAEKED